MVSLSVKQFTVLWSLYICLVSFTFLIYPLNLQYFSTLRLFSFCLSNHAYQNDRVFRFLAYKDFTKAKIFFSSARSDDYWLKSLMLSQLSYQYFSFSIAPGFCSSLSCYNCATCTDKGDLKECPSILRETKYCWVKETFLKI